MSAKVFRLLLAASLLLSSGGAFAAQPVGSVSPAFKQKLALSESNLKAIEGKMAAILSRKTITAVDEDIDKEMDAYAEQMEAASEEAEKAGGALQSSFKAMAKAHKARIDNLLKKADIIESKMKTGDIALDKAVLKKMTREELHDFKAILAPQGVQKMQKLHPDMFKPDGSTSINFFDGERVSYAAKKTGSMLIGGIGDFFSVRDATAGRCWDEFKRCRKKCRWWDFGCKLRCWRSFICCLMGTHC